MSFMVVRKGESLRIAVIGAGNVGGTLGRRWAANGHVVTFGVREGSEVKGGTPAGTRVASVEDACRGAEIVELCTPWAAAPAAIAAMGSLEGKVLFDSTNPIASGFRFDGGPTGESGAERLAALATGARVVKVFNTTGFQNMAAPVYGGEPSVMFYAGDDAEAKTHAHRLAAELGFDPVDAGPLSRARELEHLALLWISLSVSGHGRDIAFRLMRR
jgi:predicted dinucleotide-binding enzyme